MVNANLMTLTEGSLKSPKKTYEHCTKVKNQNKYIALARLVGKWKEAISVGVPFESVRDESFAKVFLLHVNI